MGKLSVNHGPEKKGGDDKGGGSGDTPKIDNGGLAAAKAFQDDIAKSLEKQLESSANLADNQDKLNKGQLESSDVGKQIQNSLQARNNAHKKIIQANKAGIIDDKTKQKLIKNINKDSLDQVKNLKSQGKEASIIENKLGSVGKVLKGMKDIPIIGPGAGKALEAMQQKAADGGSKMAVMGAGLSSATSGVLGMFGGIGGILKFILDAVFQWSNQTRDVQRNMQMSSEDALAMQDRLTAHARSTEDIFDNTKNLLAVQQSLNDYRGTAVEFAGEDLTRANKLLKANVLNNEQLGQLSVYANVAGKSFDEMYMSQVSGVNTMMKQQGVSLNVKEIFKDMAKVSGTIKAQLGANPELIGRAVTKAKSLGMTLEQVAKAGESILNFEQSIAKELEAELLTGKQLNLEKARLAALTGDYETLTEEINKNVGDFGEFSKMNVLQQKAVAEAVGMTRDELSDTLLKKADLNELAKEARDMDDIELANRFNQAIETMKQMFVEEIAPALLPFISSLSRLLTDGETLKGIFSFIKGILITLAAVKLISLVTSIMGVSTALATAAGGATTLSSALSFGAAAIAIAGAIGIIYAANKSFTSKATSDVKSAKDAVIDPEGGMLVSGPKGSIQLDKQDTIIAGTNLGGGGGKGTEIDYNKMAAAMSNAKVNVNTKLQHDSFGSYNVGGSDGEYQSEAKYGTSFV